MSYLTVWATYGSHVSWYGTYAYLKGLGDKLEALRDLQTDEVIAATVGLPFLFSFLTFLVSLTTLS